MKNNKISASLFGALTIVQMIMVLYFTTNAAIPNLPIFALAEIAAVVVFAALSLHFVCADAMSFNKKKAFLAAAILYIIFVGLHGGMEMMLAQSCFSLLLPTVTSIVPIIALIAVKTLLFVVAVAFAITPEKKAQEIEIIAEETAE